MRIVLAHRAQCEALQETFPELGLLDAATGLQSKSAIDTVERFQGGERTAPRRAPTLPICICSASDDFVIPLNRLGQFFSGNASAPRSAAGLPG
jgi:hypothetical protein